MGRHQKPQADNEDAAELGVDLATLRSLAGGSTAFARRMMGQGPATPTFALVEYLKTDRSRIAADLPPEVIEVLLGAGTPDQLSAAGTKILEMFGTIVADRDFQPARVVVESSFIEELSAASPGWRGDRSESLDRFAVLLSGAEEALWVDRYLFAQPRELGIFLRELRARTDTRLRLLGCDDRESPDQVPRLRSAICGLSAVEARTMTWSDRRHLRDRHLVLPAVRTGFVLTTAGVIIGCHDPGSAVSVRLPGLPVNYDDYWRRGTPI